MSEDFDVPSATAAPKAPTPGEPVTDPRGRKSATTTPASSKEIAQAAEKSVATAPSVPTTPDAAPVAPVLQDLRKCVLKLCKPEAQALLKVHAVFRERETKMCDLVDHRMALKRRDALISGDINPQNFEAVMREWCFNTMLASSPDGIGMVHRMVDHWRTREFEPVEVAARTFHRRISEEVEKIKARALEAENSFFSRLFGSKTTIKESPAGRLVSEMCDCLTNAGPGWEENMKAQLASAQVIVPGTLIELAEEAVALPE